MADDENSSNLRNFGLEPVGDVPWGTHLCQFYQTKEDLIDILVPYFKAGLESNEFCMWVTAEPLNEEDAKEAMERAMPNFSEYVENGQIEIISYKDWYVKGGAFDCDRVLQGWTSKLEKALKNGYAGLRLTGNTFWLEKKDWNAFTDYEEAVNDVIDKSKMIAVCTYSLDKCDSNEIIDVIRNHQFALVKRSGTWALIESSERKKIAEDLLRTEQKFAALYNLMTEGVVLHDVVYDASGNAVDYVITDANPSFEKITGLSKKQAVGQRASVLYGTGKPPYLDIYAKVAWSGKPASFETYFAPLQKHFNISVFSPSKGKFNSVFHDITERKHAEQEIQSLAKFPLENPSAVMRVDGNGAIIYCNPASKSSLTHLRCEVGRQVPAGMNKIAADALKSDTKIEFEETCGEKTFSFLFVPIVKEGYVNIYGVDTTERKAAELKLQQAKHDWERTFDSVPDLIAVLDREHKIVRANRAMAQRLGTTPERLIGLNCYECVHGTSMPLEFCPHEQTLKDEKEHLAEVQEPRLGGSFLVSTTPLKNEQGQLIGSVHVARDITERKEREQELRHTLESSHRRQAEVSALLNASKAVLQHQEFKNSARSIFDSCKELLGATAGYVALLSRDDKENEVLFLDAGGLPCRVDPLLPMPVRGLRGEAYHTGKVVYCNDFQRSEWLNLMPEGHAALQNVLFAPLTIDKKTVGIIGLANKPNGFTERDAQMALAFGEIASVALINSRMLETLEENEKLLKAHSEQLERLVEERTKKLKDAERLATIGETAGMVGHDIRNPLQSIIGELYLAKDELKSLPESDTKRSLEETVTTIEEQASYINKIVTDLQDFAKPLKPCNEETNLETILQSIISSMDIPENIELTYAFKEGFPKFKADTAYVKRILTNLFSNAIQAMPNGGKLIFHASHENGSVMINVEDTGVGIPEEAKPKLFQPLFTTKSK